MTEEQAREAADIPTTKVCIVESCEEPSDCRGYCVKHYCRWLRHGNPHVTKVERVTPTVFWRKVDKTAQCWLWMGGTDCSHGYGRAYYQGGSYRAHKLAWLFTYGEMPRFNLLHSCDVKLCVNPSHLREGTQRDNSKDMILRKRNLRCQKLTPAQALEIRERLSMNQSARSIAKLFGLGHTTVLDIKHQRTWRHVDEVIAWRPLPESAPIKP